MRPIHASCNCIDSSLEPCGRRGSSKVFLCRKLRNYQSEHHGLLSREFSPQWLSYIIDRNLSMPLPIVVIGVCFLVVCLTIWLSVCVCASLCLSLRVSLCLFVCVSVCVCLCVCLCN